METIPLVSFDIFTTVPEWFFEDSFSGQFEYHEFVTDIGLVQETPFLHDLKQTIETLGRFIPFDLKTISDTADVLKRRTCELVVCDISPIGISIAKEAGIPSVLIENFTWDWIYEDFEAGNWLPNVSQLLKFSRTQQHHRNGSYQVAGMIRDILKRGKN